MIIATSTDPEEAADLAEVLTAMFPEKWGFRIFMLGSDFRSRPPKNTGQDSRRTAMFRLIREAGPEGIAARTLYLQLQAIGQYLPRATMYRWLTEAEQAGKVFSPSYGRRAWCGPDEQEPSG